MGDYVTSVIPLLRHPGISDEQQQAEISDDYQQVAVRELVAVGHLDLVLPVHLRAGTMRYSSVNTDLISDPQTRPPPAPGRLPRRP